MTGLKIISTGHCVPSKVMTNDDYAKIVETSDEWITQRTGMKERRHITGDENQIWLATEAGREAIERAGIDKNDIDVIIVCTVSSEYYSPATACLVQDRLGLKNDMIAFDLSAGCSGFVFGMETIRGLMMARNSKAGLVIAADVLSKKIDMTDRGTCVLFGDGAGAAVVVPSENEYHSVMGVAGNEDMINIKVPNGFIKMDGQGTYKFAVATVPKVIKQALDEAGLNPEDIDHYVLHQANLRIIESIAKKLKQPMDKFIVNIEKYGNTSAASVGLALNEAYESGSIKPGEKLLLCAFGAGKTWGAIIMEA